MGIDASPVEDLLQSRELWTGVAASLCLGVGTALAGAAAAGPVTALAIAVVSIAEGLHFFTAGAVDHGRRLGRSPHDE